MGNVRGCVWLICGISLLVCFGVSMVFCFVVLCVCYFQIGAYFVLAFFTSIVIVSYRMWVDFCVLA